MKKSYRITFSILLAVGVLFLAIGLIAPFIAEQLDDRGISVGYIAGGIDFPTYMDMMFNHLYGLWTIFVHLGGAIILSSGFALIFHKTVSNSCRIVTSAFSLALSVFGAAGLIFCMLTLSTSGNELMRYPNANPTFFVCGLLCLFICIALLSSYFYHRFKRMSYRGFLFETLITIVYFPSFFWFWGVLTDFLWDILKNVI